ncbi:MAG: S8 family serine peptidase [Halobacteria archaeon]
MRVEMNSNHEDGQVADEDRSYGAKSKGNYLPSNLLGSWKEGIGLKLCAVLMVAFVTSTAFAGVAAAGGSNHTDIPGGSDVGVSNITDADGERVSSNIAALSESLDGDSDDSSNSQGDTDEETSKSPTSSNEGGLDNLLNKSKDSKQNTEDGKQKYVVGYKNQVSSSVSLSSQLGYSSLERYSSGNLTFETARLTDKQVNHLKNDPKVSYVEKDNKVKALGKPDDTENSIDTMKTNSGTQSQGTPWGIGKINASEAEGSVPDSAENGINVAVLDTGVDYTHEDLNNTVKWGVNTHGSGVDYGKDAAMDGHGHGTHVSGTIAANDNQLGVVGVAPNTSIYAIKVLSDDGWGYSSDVAQGIEEAHKGPDGVRGTADDADIISMSLGGPDAQSKREAVQNVTDDVVIISAAGNYGDGDPSTNEIEYPAKYNGSLAIAASNSQDSTAYFSAEGKQLDVAAPGVSVKSTTPGGYSTWSGTSMATPHVSGAAALILASKNDPDYGTEKVRQILTNSTKDIESSGFDKKAGHGRIDASEAVNTATKAVIEYTPSSPGTGETVTFDGSNSTPNGGITSYVWSINGVQMTGKTVNFSFEKEGSYNVTLNVTAHGNTATTEKTVNVTGSQPVGETGTVELTAAGNEWQVVNLQRSYENPVVVTSPLSYSGRDPAHVRVRGVNGDSFQINVEEWDYLNEKHATETMNYLVVEKGHHELENGMTVEAGKTSLDHGWSSVDLGESFSNPVVMSQTLTYRGRQSVVTRHRNVESGGFGMRLQEEEGNNGVHATERVGYVALEGEDVGTSETDHTWSSITQNTGRRLVQTQTFNGNDPGHARMRGDSVSYEEERSVDNEMAHTVEKIGYAGFDNTVLNATSGSTEAVGEVGSVEIGAAGSWQTVDLNGSYRNPVVVTSPLTYQGRDPAHVRVRNVGNGSFEMQVEEWNYLNEKHTTETVNYMVVEEGSHSLSKGVTLDAGRLTADHGWSSVNSPVSSGGVVLSQVMSYNGAQSVVTRHRNVGSNGFGLRLQEEEGNNGVHAKETVGYVSIDGDGAKNHQLDDSWKTVGNGKDAMFADIQSFQGNDPVGIRMKQDGSFTLEEERSVDSEMGHTPETVGVVGFDEGKLTG